MTREIDMSSIGPIGNGRSGSRARLNEHGAAIRNAAIDSYRALYAV